MEEQRARETGQLGGPSQEGAALGAPGLENRATSVFGSVLAEGASNPNAGKPSGGANVEAMTEEEQLAHAMRLSLCEPSTNSVYKCNGSVLTNTTFDSMVIFLIF